MAFRPMETPVLYPRLYWNIRANTEEVLFEPYRIRLSVGSSSMNCRLVHTYIRILVSKRGRHWGHTLCGRPNECHLDSLLEGNRPELPALYSLRAPQECKGREVPGCAFAVSFCLHSFICRGISVSASRKTLHRVTLPASQNPIALVSGKRRRYTSAFLVAKRQS